MTKEPLGIAAVLPPDAVALLTAAALVPDTLNDDPADERTRAIADATQRIKNTYPQFFKGQNHES